jgi:hypothetical protein
MAKLSAYGRTEIGTVSKLTSAKRYMSDGTVLKNIGFGWKVAGKVKPGFTPEQAFAKAAANQARALADNPAYAAYYKAIHATAGLSMRWKLHTTIELMPEDCDGVWSECCNGYGENVCADVDAIGELCRLYLAAIAENEAREAT